MLESWTSVSATGRQLGASSLAVGLWLHCYQTTGTVSDLPHSWSSLNNDPAAAMVAHLWSRFLPATVTGGTIPGLRRISSGTVKPFASQPKPTCKTPCCSSAHATKLHIFKMTPCWQKQQRHLSMTMTSLLICFIFKQFASVDRNFCSNFVNIWWEKQKLKTVPGKLLFVLSMHVWFCKKKKWI